MRGRQPCWHWARAQLPARATGAGERRLPRDTPYLYAGLHVLPVVPQQQSEGGRPRARRHQHADLAAIMRTRGKRSSASCARARCLPWAPGGRTKRRYAALASLEAALDGRGRPRPNPGRTDTIRRLNRTEYQNAIRDLLALDIDAAALLPTIRRATASTT